MPDLNVIMGLPPKTKPNDVVSIDLEIFGMTEHRLHRPDNGTFASMQICPDGKNVYIVTNEHDVAQALRNVQLSTHVFHNSAFDMTHLRRWGEYPVRENYADTYIFEKLLWSGYYHDFGLNDLTRRYFSEYMDKDIRSEFIKEQELSPEMIRYGAFDAFFTWHNYQEQLKLMTDKLWHVWNKIDGPCIFAIMDFKGFTFNAEKWLRTAELNAQKAKEIKDSLGFNPNSPKQVLAKLQASGLRKLKSTGEEELIPYRDYPLVQQILEYRKYSKRASTYGADVVNKFYEPDGKIHSSYNVDGAETGRLSSDNPNGQNVIAEEPYRSCFIASDENHRLIINDYRQQEPRITAHESGDPHLIEICRSGKNIHLEVGKVVFNEPNLKKSDIHYKHSKAINLAITYGMTANGLKRKINEDATTPEEKITEADAEKLLRSHFREFPLVKRWIDKQHSIGSRQEYVETTSGRKTWLNTYSYQWMNNSLNNPIQGGGADVTKLAINKIHKECRERGLDYPLVSTIHDEIVADVPLSMVDEYSELMERAMTKEAGDVYASVPFEVDHTVGTTWWDAKG